MTQPFPYQKYVDLFSTHVPPGSGANKRAVFAAFFAAAGNPAPRRQQKLRHAPPDRLKNSAQAAAKLGCSIKTLKGHVATGALRYVVIGHGSKRPRRMFTDADLNAFIEVQTRKDAPCPSSASRARHTGTSTSSGEVIAFTDRRRPQPSAKRKR